MNSGAVISLRFLKIFSQLANKRLSMPRNQFSVDLKGVWLAKNLRRRGRVILLACGRDGSVVGLFSGNLAQVKSKARSMSIYSDLRWAPVPISVRDDIAFCQFKALRSVVSRSVDFENRR